MMHNQIKKSTIFLEGKIGKGVHEPKAKTDGAYPCFHSMKHA